MIVESVGDEFQTILDKDDGTPSIVENPDDLDYEIGWKANKIGPYVG